MKALKLAFESGFLAGKQDGWSNNPAIERAWKAYVAQMKEIQKNEQNTSNSW